MCPSKIIDTFIYAPDENATGRTWTNAREGLSVRCIGEEGMYTQQDARKLHGV